MPASTLNTTSVKAEDEGEEIKSSFCMLEVTKGLQFEHTAAVARSKKTDIAWQEEKLAGP